MNAPKPSSRPGRVSLLRYLRLFRQDILSAQPGHLYGAKMAEFRAPFLRSFLVNDPALVRDILAGARDRFPKSRRLTAGLRRLLGASVFVTNGELWARQRGMIDGLFAPEDTRRAFPAIRAASSAFVARLAPGEAEIEARTSHYAADVIFRTLFSLPIEDSTATRLYTLFRCYQRAQPLLTPAALAPWLPDLQRRDARAAARDIRALIGGLVAGRRAAIAEGRAPEDLATRLLTARDPTTGQLLDADEACDQIAIFLLAGHETSASALAWALYLVAGDAALQDRIAAEWRDAAPLAGARDVARLSTARDVFRESLRLYPPVPMLVREAACPAVFRRRAVRPGDQVIVSLWHLHRHVDRWQDPDRFDPERWRRGMAARDVYLPFSAGPRVCPGAGFAMIEGTVAVAEAVAAFRLDQLAPPPRPVAHLTVRAADGIRLGLTRRRPS